MSEDISNRTLALLIIVALAISLGSALMSLNLNNRLGVILGRGQGITGFTVVTGTGYANVTINSLASLRFSIGRIDFGAGSVNTSGNNQICSMFTNNTGGGKDPINRCVGFNNAGTLFSLEMENDGSSNLSINVTFDKNATQYIGGLQQLEHLLYTITNNESNTCAAPWPNGAWVEVINQTSYAVCNASTGGMGFVQTRNSLTLSINLTIPYDSLKAGQPNQNLTITATGTSVP